MYFRLELRLSILLLPILFCFAACTNKNQVELSTVGQELANIRAQFLTPELNKDSLKIKLDSLRDAISSSAYADKSNYYIAQLEYYHKFMADHRKALLFADSAINVLYNKPAYYNEIATVHFFKADILLALGNYNEAINSYFQSKKYVDKVKNDCTSSIYSYRIAMVLFKQNKYDDARFFFKEGLAEGDRCRNREFVDLLRQQEFRNNIALCFSKTLQLDSAIFWYKDALKYLESAGKKHASSKFLSSAKGVIYGNLGGVYLQKGNFLEAEKLLLKSVAINDKPFFDINDARTAKFKLIDLYLSSNKLFAAKRIIAEVDDSIEKLNLEHSKVFEGLKTKYYNLVGDYKQAFISQKAFNSINDSLNKQIEILKSVDLVDRFKFLDVEEEVGTLKKQHELQTFLLIITSLFVVVAVGLIIIIYFYWNKSRRSIKALELVNFKETSQNIKLAETLKELETSDKEKDRILRAVAHDLRNPIVGISGVVEIMKAEDESRDQDLKYNLVKGACDDALGLISDLIEAAENKDHIDIETRKSREDYIVLVKNAVNLLGYKAASKSQNLNLTCTEEELKITVYRDKINRVLGNLINNAIKFTKANKTIDIIITVANKEIITCIKDQGIGIPEHQKEDVFLLFTHAKRIGTEGEKSHGLGLFISKQIVEAHGGQVWIADNPTGGTMFYFSLPLK